MNHFLSPEPELELILTSTPSRKVALIGLKIALLNHEVAWDLWNKADALASKLQPWYPVDKTFEACAKNVEFFNAYGHPKTGPKRVLNQRQSDVITKNGGGDEDINKAMDWINKTWYQDGMPKEFSGDVVREKYAKERNEIVRLCGAHWREE